MDYEKVERDRGFLTQRDRRFLLGELDDELSDNSITQKRYQIRKRIQNAMLDFWFLNNTLSTHDISLLWEDTDYWLSKSRSKRRRDEAPPYPKLPFLAECWRELIAFFVYSQISTEMEESKLLVEWVLEQGVNKGVRRHFFESLHAYQEIDSSIEWGAGDRFRLQQYLEYISNQMPKESDQAESYLENLVDKGYLQDHHAVYLYQSVINPEA